MFLLFMLTDKARFIDVRFWWFQMIWGASALLKKSSTCINVTIKTIQIDEIIKQF